MKRFISLEKRFRKNLKFSKIDHVPINEYIDSGQDFNKTRSTKNFRM